MQHLKRTAALAAAVAALLVSATAASAAVAPGYEEFDDCPSKTVNSNIILCQITEVTSGHLKLGTKNTPITDPITLIISADDSGNTYLGSFDGGRQMIPGGLTGITGLDWLSWLFPFSLLAIHAEAELAGPVGNAFAPTLSLPLKVHLDNPLLNNNCYIGSNSNPVALQLTTGTTSPPPPNTPISGNTGIPEPDPVLPQVFRAPGIKLVDNSFAAPGASGCDLIGFGLINALVNLQSGLPSAAGRNETVQNATGSLVFIEAAYPPAGFE